MKPSASKKISTITLWICITAAVGIFAWFYSTLNLGFGAGETEVSTIVTLILFLILLSVSSVLFFTLKYYLNNPKKTGKTLLYVVAFCLMLLAAFLLGDGKPLEISGYKGTENTPFWLRLTDMWIYAIVALIAVAAIFLVSGIIWSYIKKIR
jgi:hypothetical protein